MMEFKAAGTIHILHFKTSLLLYGVMYVSNGNATRVLSPR